jgi:hypothetical protein
MRLLFTLGALGCVYDAPIDEDAPLPAPVLAGTVVVSGASGPADAMVLIYPAENPPPPLGTGRPLTFGTVPASAFRAGSGGTLEANFQVSTPGLDTRQVLVTALFDVDGDFSPLPPFSDVLGGATCGDLSGAHITDTTSGALAVVTVPESARLDGITVLVARPNTLERPAFVFQGGTPSVSRAVAEDGGTQTFRLASTGVHAELPASDGSARELLEIADPGTADPCATSFWVTARDVDLNGLPDPHPDYPPDAGILDVWPRVYLQYLGEVDEQGRVSPALAAGESWSGQAAFFPMPIYFGQVPLNRPTPLTEGE